MKDATYGYLLSSEEWDPADLIKQAIRAQDAGFEALAISDHFHPWNDQQSSSAFVWGVIGALSREVDLPISTHVTAPIVPMHPAIVAHAAATAGLLNDGFVLGVGTGEALNEQVLRDPWPLAPVRLAVLEEAVSVMRKLWTGDVVTHRGQYYKVEHARLYTTPEHPVPVYMSGFGPEAVGLAGKIADGYVTTSPSRESLELSQDLRTHFMQVSEIVTGEQMRSALPCGPKLEDHLDLVRRYEGAGFDQVFIGLIGPRQEEFARFAADELLPALRGP